MKTKLLTRSLFTLALLAAPLAARAQWVTQTISLKAGWNAVYLHVDASYASLAELVAADSSNPISDIWMWAPMPSKLQFVQSPQEPISANSQWISWSRQDGEASSLQRLGGNVAYLVRVATNVSTYTWSVKGKPVPPSYDQWSTAGLNFQGFPVVPASPPTFYNFLAKTTNFVVATDQVYAYNGGELSASNPGKLTLNARSTTQVKRGQAYWIRSDTYFNGRFAPFEVTSGSKGIDFGSDQNVGSLRLRNLTAASLTVTLRLVASETPPNGQANIVGTPPLLVRGSMNTTNLTYTYTALPVAGTRTWTLPPNGSPGCEVDIGLGLNRAAMTGSAGALHAGVLRLTDSLNFFQVDLPVSATAQSSAGLWVGAAVITQVGQYLKTYAKDADGNLVVSSNGQYQVQSINTNLSSVASAVPLRLIVHNPAAGSGGHAVLLQRVYVGADEATNAIVATQESLLNAGLLSLARRISATHLPWSRANTSWTFDGTLDGSGTLTTQVETDYADQASNPFLHTYHPDHDNLDVSFKNALPQGSESYTIRRTIALSITPPAANGSDFTAGDRTVSGTYAETVSLVGLARSGGLHDTRTFETRGYFSLKRVSTTPVLTKPAP